jgi:hypothetical protein
VDVEDGEIQPCWTGEQLLDWTLGVGKDTWRLVWSWKSPWVERRFEDLTLDFVILTKERTLRSRGRQEKKNSARRGKSTDVVKTTSLTTPGASLSWLDWELFLTESSFFFWSNVRNYIDKKT